MARLALQLLLLMTAAALMAPTAFATDYCVAPNTSCGGMNVASFEAALDAADDGANADRIFLGAATYTAPSASGFVYSPGVASPVEIVGQGVGSTVVTSLIGGNLGVLRIGAQGVASVHDLTVRLPQNAASSLTGLDTDGLAQRIEVIEAATQVNVRTGVRLVGTDAVLEDSTVTIGAAQNTLGIAATGGATITRSTVQARRAVSSVFGSTIARSVLSGSTGLEAAALATTITDSLIRTTGPSSTGVFLGTESGQDTTLNADGLTVVGPGGASTSGVFVSTGADPENATANVVDTVFRGFGATLATSASGSGQADINASYSDYDPAGNVDGGTGDITASNVTNLGDARFVDPASGDYRLRFDSPLIDIGEPGAPTTTVDLAGGARLVGARRDIGAYEYQARAPLAAIAGPAAAQTGEQLIFSATGSSDPDAGDTLSYAWTLDGAPAGNGPTLGASFQTAGPHAVGLTVTDPTGHQASASQAVSVSDPPAVGVSNPPAVADLTAPVISGLLARPARVPRGRAVRFSFTLDEPGAVSVKIQRARPGRRERGVCRRPSRRNRGGRRCIRWVRVTTLNARGKTGANRVRFSGRVRGRALLPGRYRAVVQATDAAGNRSIARRVPFIVTRA